MAPTPLNFSFRYEIEPFLATTTKVEKLLGSIVCLTQWQTNDHHSLRIQWAAARSFASIVLSKYPPAKCFRWLGFLCAWLYLYFHFYFYLYWQIQPDCMWMLMYIVLKHGKYLVWWWDFYWSACRLEISQKNMRP